MENKEAEVAFGQRGVSMRQMYKTDTQREKEGIWIDYGAFQVRIARCGGANAEFTRALRERSKPYKKLAQTGNMPEAVYLKILREVFADTIIRGWETWVGDETSGGFRPGIEPLDPAEELLPATRDNVVKTLEEMPDLFEDIQTQSANLALFRELQQEEDSKNLPSSSATA